MKLEDVRIKWTSGAACPSDIHLDYIYHIVIENNKIKFSDGNFEKEIEIDALQNIFTPVEGSWQDVEFPKSKSNK